MNHRLRSYPPGESVKKTAERLLREHALVFEADWGLPENGEPNAIAPGQKGNFWVSDRKNHRILEIDGKGGAVRVIGGKGSNAGLFETPSGLMDAFGALFVCDYHNRRVQVFKHGSQEIRIIDGLSNPFQMVKVGETAFAVAEKQHKKVRLFSQDLDEIGMIMVGREKKLYPTFGMGFDASAQRLLVSEAHRVFSYALSAGGERPTCCYHSEELSLDNINELVFDGEGTLYVLDRVKKMIGKLFADGSLAEFVMPDTIVSVERILPYKDRKLYVVDSEGAKIHVFKPPGF